MSVYLSAVAFSVVALVLGAAICRLLRVAGWLAPALGLSAAMLIVLATIRLPGEVWAAVGALGGALLASAVVLVRSDLTWPDVRSALARGLPVALVLLAAGSLPFLAYGRIGELGPGFNPDPFFHMGQADQLRAIGLDARVTRAAYPIGPHTLVATLSAGLGVGIQPAFVGLLLAIPVLAGLTALAGLEDLARGRRLVAASLVGLPYLAASYFVQGAFKELILACLYLASALTVRSSWERRLPVRGPVLAIVLLGGGGAVAFGWPAFAWPAVMLAVFAVLAGRAGILPAPHLQPQARRRLVIGVGATVLAAAIIVAGAVASGFFDGAGKFTFTQGAGGNFYGQISPLQAVGTWPASDFRDRAEGNQLVFSAIVAFGAVVVAWGLAWCWRRRELALLAAALGGLLIYAVARPLTLAYNSGKALAVVAPVLTLAALRALFVANPRAEGITSGRSLARFAVAVAFVGAMAASSALALRAALPRAQEFVDDVATLRPTLRGEPTLYLGRHDWMGWDLRGSDLSGFQAVATPLALRLQEQGTKSPRVAGTDVVDIDSLPPESLDRFRYVVAPRTAYLSDFPANFTPVRRTRWHVLWRRDGATPARDAIDENSAPGAVLSCTHRPGRDLVRGGGVAFVRPRPVTAPAEGWRIPGLGEATGAGVPPSPGETRPGGSLVQTLALEPGSWEIALAYTSPVPLRLRAAGLDAALPAYHEDLSRLVAAGRITTSIGGPPVRVEVTADDRPLINRRLQLGMLAATRLDDRGQVVPPARACGRYVDWLRPRP